MSKINPLAGLIGNYDDSEEEGDDTSMQSVAVIPSGVKAPIKTQPSEAARSGIHRAPISHCRKFLIAMSYILPVKTS